ncbi:MAG: tRNA epoxyqueuosine(34) reductase QueG [Acidobacteria bacterium]|nr:tRNA epoxyqueuosine(34) reductase QueG [Acidobacteriota bacterium]
MDDLTSRLKRCAIEEGLDLVGVAAAATVPGAPRFEAWLDAGMHGEMSYMARTAAIRCDPRRLLPGCSSVVAVAVSYHTSWPLSTDDGELGTVWVSRYAWGRDYHRLLKKRLLRLGRWLEAEVPGCSWRACVDTAPVLEREWAAQAGLGWIGKSTCLLSRKLGSELFLGILLTDVALSPDGPVPEHCGRCTACLEACPTAAFPEPGVLDARRCIGYLTVEHRGSIRPELEPAVSDMVAGCDICQEVCPWTRGAPADLHPELQPVPHRFRPRLEDLERLDEEGYREWRRGSPLNRIPFPAFRRNLEVARRNLGDVTPVTRPSSD